MCHSPQSYTSEVEFGAAPFEGLTYTTSMEDIGEGLNRIEETLKELSTGIRGVSRTNI